MARYIVRVAEIHRGSYAVDADSEAEALAKVLDHGDFDEELGSESGGFVKDDACAYLDQEQEKPRDTE